MKSNYKRLGDYIEVVEERNRDFSVTLSQGICNLKYFQNPRQVAENSAADKIVRKGWFAYNRATTRNGDKISIAYRDGEDCTVSASYLTFKIKDENLLNPYYLMMWFKRPEFDRYARFKSHGSAHEYFEWEEMCEVMLPVPSIGEQREIVAEYQAVERRIENNRRLITTLEDAAQTIYRRMFVDNIDPNNLPEDWYLGRLGDICDICMGQSPDGDTLNETGDGIIFYQGRTDFGQRFPSIRMFTTDPKKLAKKGDTLLSVRAPVGDINVANNDCCIGRGIASIRSKSGQSSYVYYLVDSLYEQISKSNDEGTIFGSINKEELTSFPLVIPPVTLVDEFNQTANTIDDLITDLCEESSVLTKIIHMYLSNITKF